MRDLAQARYNVLASHLRLRQAPNGTVTPDDLVRLKRPAGGTQPNRRSKTVTRNVADFKASGEVCEPR